jgi:preprotein translocase subunit SecY
MYGGQRLHPAEGQPGGRHPDHLRQRGPQPAGAAQPGASRRRLGQEVSNFIDDVFRRSTHPLYLVFYGLLIVGFAYFYTAIAFDPVQQADNLRKQGGHIPGYPPGTADRAYLAKVLSRITLPGALFIAVLAIAPAILVSQIVNDDNGSIAYNFGGTSLLIAVGVALETMKQIDGQLMMRNYEGFLGGK